MPSRTPSIYDKRPGRAPIDEREPRNSSLPKHLRDIKLPTGATLGDLKPADVARLCALAGIPGASHENGIQKNAELLSSTLEAIGREAAEKAIDSWLREKLK